MALRDQPYLPLYVQDFMTDEKLAECSPAATGVYIRVMCLMHKSEQYGKVLLKQKDKQTGKQILDFALKIAKHLPYDLREIESALEELISEDVLTVVGDCLFQKRMVRDCEISNKRANAGKKGGKKTQSFASQFAKAKSKANSEYENEYINDKIKEEGGTGEETIAESDFEKVWEMYGRKGNKKSCLQKWTNLTKKNQRLALAHIPKYVQSTPNKLYRKNFETYINQEAWNDEIITGNERHETTDNGILSGNERKFGSTSGTKQSIIARAKELDRRRAVGAIQDD